MPRRYVPVPDGIKDQEYMTDLLVSIGACERELHNLGNHWPSDPRQVTGHLMRALSALAGARSAAAEIQVIHSHWRDQLLPQHLDPGHNNGRIKQCPISE